MFKKKRASSVASSTSRNAAPASSAASSAAIQAFMANRASTTNLSSAAAAAALRSHTTSPTPVGDIQTRRMMERASSRASNASTSRRPLSRQSSIGSMTDRTFREPSPGRPASQAATEKAPPLPPLPLTLPTSPKSKGKKQVGEPSSPVATRSSLEHDPRSSLERADGKRVSVNFSRPMSPPLSPPASPTSPTRPRVSSLSAADQEAIEHAVADAATAPVKKKKKKAPQVTEGSHLSAGTVGGKPTGAAVVEPTKKKKKQPATQLESQAQHTEKQMTRASGALAKQPSVVREDREGEEMEEKLTNGHALAPSDASSRLSPLDTAVAARRNSNSPSRTASFSAQPVTPANGRLHEPLGRSASPGKSAMKRTPSPRGPSPGDRQWNRASFTPSEASDVPSHASDETRKKKKAVHVKFDDEPIVVGQAAEQTNASPVVASPQNERQRKGWFSFSKDKTKPSAIDEEDDYMKPRPALPSFGSIRGKQDSKDDSKEGSVHAASSDHAIGAIVHKSIESHQSPVPVGTSVGGDVGHSETDESAADAQTEPASTDLSTPETEGQSESETQPAAAVERSMSENASANGTVEVPATSEPSTTGSEPKEAGPTVTQIPEIAIQPSTPGLETDAKRDSYIDVPGGFPSGDFVEDTDPQPSSPEHTTSDVSTAESAETRANVGPDNAEGDDSDDSGNSVYSDAASDATDFDGDGFGSINAIIESPMPASKKQKSAAARSPTPPIPDHETTTPTSSKSTNILEEQTRSANEITESKASPASDMPQKKSAEPKKPLKPLQPVESQAGTPTKPAKKKVVKIPKQESEPAPEVKKSPKTKKPTPTQVNSVQAVPTKSVPKSPPNPEVKPLKPAIKSPTRRTSVSPSPHRFRSSMRNSAIQPRTESLPRKPKTPLKTPSDDMPLDARKVLALQKKRPMSVASDSPIISNGGLRVRSNSRPVSMSGIDLPLSAAPPVPKLPGGDDSDSDSSFKRMRARRNRGNDGRVSMRRSMRAAPMHTSATVARPSSMHSTMSAARPTSMRMSMRPSSPEPLPTQSSRKFFGVGRKDKDSRAMSPEPQTPHRFRHRAADSDSEDEIRLPTKFRSRFADSSDEEDEELTPVRGIPRAGKDDEGDSTDLEGEGESVRSPNASKAKLALIIPNGGSKVSPAAGEGTALATKTMREPDLGRAAISQPNSPIRGLEKRRSFFGNLGRRKDKTSKVGKLDAESAARRDTPLERSRADRTAPPPVNTLSSIPGSPTEVGTPVQRSPKLIKRRTFSNPNSIPKVENWPAAPPIPEDLPSERPALSRPQTSDGAPAKRLERPVLGNRVLSGTALPTEMELAGKAKKRRFAALRKAFGMKSKA